MFYDKNMPPMPFDMKKARALIKESGIKPEDYTIRQLSFPYGSTWDRLGEYTKQALEQLGFKVNLESTDAGGWAIRRPRSGRAAPVHHLEHRQGFAVRQRAGLQQPRDRQAVGGRGL
ncbi:hypothetical protein G6F31_020762 [Rhizopus arrhizus]|nr:hypothetical protein G6F31_020762 [Rhizopus arrhizus]